MNDLAKTSVFEDSGAFENAQRMAKALSQSDLVPAIYKNNLPNTMIALEMAHRTGSSPLMVMQNLDIIKGKPSWSSQFIISALNSCGRFEPLRFEFEGVEKTDDYGCYAYTKSKLDGKTIKGPKVTWKMVKGEGWFSKKDKNGNETSKWQTMPELMFQYRSASFFGRLHAPDVLQGMYSKEEIEDIGSVQVSEEQKDINKDFQKPIVVEGKTVDDGEMI